MALPGSQWVTMGEIHPLTRRSGQAWATRLRVSWHLGGALARRERPGLSDQNQSLSEGTHFRQARTFRRSVKLLASDRGSQGRRQPRASRTCTHSKPGCAKMVIRAGKAFASAPRTFALELTRAGANTGCGADDSIGMTEVETDDGGGRAGGDRGRSGRALVAVMKPADLGDGDDMPG
jgi:hypothetical protein